MRKTVICTDFFDTIMYREIHSSQLLPQWERLIKNKFDISEKEDIKKTRYDIIRELGINSCAIDYKTLIQRLYQKLKQIECISCSLEEFYNFSYIAETYIDYATQYPNRKMIRYLRRQKRKGKKIYLVTDYYLPEEAYKIFLGHYGLPDLFDKIFCSADYGKTKAEGSLYEEIIAFARTEPEQIRMIGDNRASDVRNPKKYGLSGRWYFPLFHKIKTNLHRLLNSNYSGYCWKTLYRHTYRNTAFGEYGLSLYYFSKKLNASITETDAKVVGFLSRGGYLLKKIYDDLQYFGEKKVVETVYLRNSRKANRNAESDTEQQTLLVEYFKPYISENNKLYIVDEGWNASSQISLTKMLGCQTYGYYIGLLNNQNCDNCIRRGLLFHIDSSGKKDSFYGVFRTNLKFYEQILTESRGGVERYARKDGKVSAILKSNGLEDEIYEMHTKRLQDSIIGTARSLMVWEASLNKKQLALCMVKTLLIANRERIQILQDYIKMRFNNFSEEVPTVLGDGMPVHISLKTFLIAPEEYMRYYCRIKDVMADSWIKRTLYRPIGILISFVCGISIILKSE